MRYSSVGETSNGQTWLRDNIIPVVILVLGVVILFAARSGNFSKAVTVFALAFLGFGMLAMASGSHYLNAGNWVLSLFGA